MVPPGRPRKGPHIHFQLRDAAQAAELKAAIKELGLVQAEALCEAVDVWLEKKRRAKRAARKREDQ